MLQLLKGNNCNIFVIFHILLYFFCIIDIVSLETPINRFLKLMAMVWAGSQVTKIVRAGGSVLKTIVIIFSLQNFFYFSMHFNLVH